MEYSFVFPLFAIFKEALAILESEYPSTIAPLKDSTIKLLSFINDFGLPGMTRIILVSVSAKSRVTTNLPFSILYTWIGLISPVLASHNSGIPVLSNDTFTPFFSNLVVFTK